MQGRQTLPLGLHPVVVVAGHQFTAVQRLCLRGAAGTQVALKVQRVAGQRAAHHTHALAVGLQHGRAGHAGGFKQALQG